jgi:hypothetical protein
MPDTSSDLIAEQLSHALDLIKAENAATKAKLDHESEVLRMEIAALKTWQADAESRIRTVQDGVTQFKVLAGLATGGGLLSLAALVKMLSGN